MRKFPAIAVVSLMACMSNGAPAQSPGSVNQGAPVAPTDGPTRLGLDAAATAELQNDLQGHDLKNAEQLLIQAADRDPGSLHARNVLIFAGHIFFLDRNYLNAA